MHPSPDKVLNRHSLFIFKLGKENDEEKSCPLILIGMVLLSGVGAGAILPWTPQSHLTTAFCFPL